MSKADIIFKEMCEDILNNGTDTKGEKVRPKWEDGSDAYTIKKFGVVNRYDLSKEFPALTLRRTAIKSATDEVLWIWQQKSNNINDLHSHIWDEWADESGSIGKAYGYQMSIMHQYKDIREAELLRAFYNLYIQDVVSTYKGENCLIRFYTREKLSGKDFEKITNSSSIDNRIIAVHIERANIWFMNQVNRAIYDLVNNPYSRRIMTNIYNHHDLSEMTLYPCAYSMTFNVTTKLPDGTVPTNNKLVLNGILNQRSQDVLAANNWNVVQYSVLLHMLARHCNMVVGEFVHVIADAHIYDRHIQLIKELISREEHAVPFFSLNPAKYDFYSFTKDDVSLINYETGPQIKNIPIAV